jgi:hypothetical protein
MAKKTPPSPTGKVTTIREALEKAEPRPGLEGMREAKKNYAEQLSRNIATCIANALREKFPGIMPSETGEQQESPARTAKGLKKLDVNYSTPQLGLAWACPSRRSISGIRALVQVQATFFRFVGCLLGGFVCRRCWCCEQP